MMCRGWWQGDRGGIAREAPCNPSYHLFYNGPVQMVLSAFSQSGATETKVIPALGIYFFPQSQGESPAVPCPFKFINITLV